ncbi:MAG: hypothetical protein EZS26_001200 [Candidatus Ordinivivax streblomastigis]|uniref:DUF2520 domain-containing protein n=1 Tax=Candidatus Ordinivivax streblomastigis TaxID=2540710 RepID=A0A5M8P2L8_9BACT|nr:MAG: hypothetical protein EZS26_001200 [Candidatus Ordinivivax streblomastigis]
METRHCKIVLIGAGNVATQLGSALQKKGFPILQVYSQTLPSASALGKRLQADYTHQIQEINLHADLYIFAVKDSALSGLLNAFPQVDGLLVHTAGSLPMSIFEETHRSRYGVFYPLQTFSKNRDIAFDHIPLFIEAYQPQDEQLLESMASELSGTVLRLSSEKRKHLHLAAVFACNFTNHLYHLSAQILEKQDLPWPLLLPLIEETASKVKNLPPKEAQTGPAVRYDTHVMDRHLELLQDEVEMQEVYKLISEGIHRQAT